MSDTVATVDLAVRLMAVGASVVLVVGVVGSRTAWGVKWPLLGVLTGAACYAVNSSPNLALTGFVDLVLELGAMLITFFVWMFARRLFEREPPRWIVMAWAGGLIAAWVAVYTLPDARGGIYATTQIVSLIFMVDLFRIAWLGREDDLIEKRRLLRLWLPLSIGLLASFILMAEVIAGRSWLGAPVQLGVGITILVLLAFATIVLFDPDASLLPPPPQTGPPVGEDGLNASETVLKARLEAAMAEGFHRTPGLTIVALAAHLDVPEHRLRALINRALRWRNFSAFLNSHRVAEAKTKLSDPAMVDLPVTTIAFDLGYNSLATFNRAFRSVTGTTPTEFREKSVVQN